MKKTRYWKVWSIDALGNAYDGWEFNDRHPLSAFEFDLTDGMDDETAIKELFKALESQDDDFSFTQAMADGAIRAEWQDEDTLCIYKKDDGRPLFTIEKIFC